jgi:choline dehydrogenase-like flavoprotein
MKTDFDIVIIGSGAGGAPIAREMALAGNSVLVLEKGPLLAPQYQTRHGRSSFQRDELMSDGSEKKLTLPGLSNTNESFYTSHVEPDLNDEPHIYRNADGSDRATIEGYTAQVVGGGTQIYGGVSLRFTPTDLQLQTFNADRPSLPFDPNDEVKRESRDWPITYDELEPYYCKTEKLIGLNGEQQNQQKPFSETDTYQPPLTPNPISKFAYDGMQALAKTLDASNPIQPYRTPLAVITRDHAPSGRKIPNPESAKTSFVNRYGDPLGYKSSTWVALLSPLTQLPNFEIRCNCVVTRLQSNGAKVDRVYYLDPAGREQSVTGKVVVVACSAIESVRLLKLSAALEPNFDQRINQNDLLGKYFLTHCFGGASALMPGRYDKSRSLDADWATDCCSVKSFLDSRQLWAGAAIYNNTSDQALPLSLLRTHFAMDLDTLWVGFVMDTSLRAQGLIDFLDKQFGRGLSVSFMGNHIPQKSNRIELHPRVTDKWNRPVAHIIKTWHPHDAYLMDTMAQQCGEILRLGAGHFPGFEFQGQGSVKDSPLRIANHILGGARFGNDRADSVLDKNCRAWSFDNLYVTDGACMPTSGGANPTNTIEANSFRVADHIKSLF